MLTKSFRALKHLKPQVVQASRAFASGLQKFNYQDPLNFDGLLTDEERMVQETAQQYAQ